MSADANGQTFYPSVTVNLRLRFDEAMQVDAGADIPEPLPQDGIADAVTGAAPNVVRPLITQRGADNLSFVVDRVPRSAQVELPAYRQAGKFTLELDWRELPIDPRLLRAVGIEIYIGAVDPSDFATGMTRVDRDGRRRSILNTQDAAGSPNDDLMALAGVVDNWSVTHSGASMVKLEGRDLRGVLLDSPVNPIVVAQVDLTQPLINVVCDILRKHPASQYMRVLYNPGDWPGGQTPPVADLQGLTRVRLAASGSQASDKGESEQPNFWDLITRYCFLVGAIPFFRGRNLVIRPSRSIFDQSKPYGQSPAGSTSTNFQAIDLLQGTVTSLTTGGLAQATTRTWDPAFGGDGVRVDDDGKRFTVRKFVYGRNVKELKFERKFTGVKVPVVEVVSYDTSSTNRGKSKLLLAQWPPEDKTAARMSGVYPSGDVSQTDKIQISVPGVRDLQRLTGIARALYEEIGRGELGGSCSTGFLSSYKGSNRDPDICRLRPGHAVEFIMDKRGLGGGSPASNTELALERASFDDAVQQIKAALRSTDDNLARVIVASSRSSVIGLLRTFRTANVVFNWDQTSGLQTSFDFQNYLVVRHDVSAPLGANVQPSVVTTIARSPAKEAPVGPVAEPPPRQPTWNERYKVKPIDTSRPLGVVVPAGDAPYITPPKELP